MTTRTAEPNIALARFWSGNRALLHHVDGCARCALDLVTYPQGPRECEEGVRLYRRWIIGLTALEFSLGGGG